MENREIELKLSPYLVVKPEEHNKVYAFLANSGTFIVTDPWFVMLVAKLRQAVSFTYLKFFEISKEIVDETEIQELFLALCSTNFLIENTAVHINYGIPSIPWDGMGWGVAKLFHEGTVFSSFAQGDDDGWDLQDRSFQQISKEGDGPPLTKEDYFSCPFIQLSAPTGEDKRSFFEVLMSRRTCRTFSGNKKINQELLSNLLHYAARAQKMINHHYFGQHIQRTTPSGGARHPVEIYPQILNSQDIEKGNYYYHPLEHKLFQLGETSAEKIYILGQQQSGCENVSIAFLITVRFSRNMWKYRYAKSYMFSLFDVGHFVQTLILCCEALGLKCFLTPAINVEFAHAHLGLKNIYDETAVYLVTAG